MATKTLSDHPVAGLYEHFYGVEDLAEGVKYWSQLGYEVAACGSLSAAAATKLYGVNSGLESVRLRHLATAEHGLIRLMKWDKPQGPGLQWSHPLSIGSRWSGFYAKDILEIHDAYSDQANAHDEHWQVTEPSRIYISEAIPDFYQPFVGIRECFVIGEQHRHAFLSRVKFDRAGFGTFADGTPLACTEAVAANIVMPSFDTHTFYSEGLGLAVHTEAIDLDWTMPPIKKALSMKDGQSFSVIVYQVPGAASGLLRVYGMKSKEDDKRDVSGPGQLGLCCFSFAYAAGTLAYRAERLKLAGASNVCGILPNEFDEKSLTVVAPDGYVWHILERGY